jgi:hypothetical protein
MKLDYAPRFANGGYGKSHRLTMHHREVERHDPRVGGGKLIAISLPAS